MIERLMRAWARRLSRAERCEWCRLADRKADTHEGRYCSTACQDRDGETFAIG